MVVARCREGQVQGGVTQGLGTHTLPRPGSLLLPLGWPVSPRQKYPAIPHSACPSRGAVVPGSCIGVP